MSFLNMKAASRLIKEAYKEDRLLMGNLNGGYIVGTGSVLVWTSITETPNKLKALMMELGGFLPSAGQLWVLGKDKHAPEPVQHRVDSIIAAIEAVEDDGEAYGVTGISLDCIGARRVAVLQTKDFSVIGCMAGLDRDKLQLIDKTEIDLDKEGEPTGPMKCGNLGAFYWYNALCTVVMYPFKISGDINLEILEMLDGMNLLGDIR